jgi:hypothetical protein
VATVQLVMQRWDVAGAVTQPGQLLPGEGYRIRNLPISAVEFVTNATVEFALQGAVPENGADLALILGATELSKFTETVQVPFVFLYGGSGLSAAAGGILVQDNGPTGSPYAPFAGVVRVSLYVSAATTIQAIVGSVGAKSNWYPFSAAGFGMFEYSVEQGYPWGTLYTTNAITYSITIGLAVA